MIGRRIDVRALIQNGGDDMTTALTRWTPETDLFRTRFDRLFNQMLGDIYTPAGETMSGRGWMPAVDVRETPEHLTFTVDLPGLSKDDVNLTIENHVLTLSGERKFEKEAKGEEYHRVERSFGSFSRSFTLPSVVQTDKVDASFANGILTISLPKQENAKPRKIAIR